MPEAVKGLHLRDRPGNNGGSGRDISGESPTIPAFVVYVEVKHSGLAAGDGKTVSHGARLCDVSGRGNT